MHRVPGAQLAARNNSPPFTRIPVTKRRLAAFLSRGRIMPLYEYVCYKCGNSFESLRRMTDDDKELRCPACGSEKIERVLSTFSRRRCGGLPSGFG